MADVNEGVEEDHIYEMIDLNSETTGELMYSDGLAHNAESAHIDNVTDGAADDRTYETVDGNTEVSGEDEYTLARVCTSQAHTITGEDEYTLARVCTSQAYTSPCTSAHTTESAHIANVIEDRNHETVKHAHTTQRLPIENVETVNENTEITGEDEYTLARVGTSQAHTITGEDEYSLARVCTSQAYITPCVDIANVNIGAEEDNNYETINENTIIMSNNDIDTDDYTLARINEIQANTENYCKRKVCKIVVMTIICLIVIAQAISLGVILTLKHQDFDDCINRPCMHNATCMDGLNSYSCRCLPGYNGTKCEIDIDECMSGPCTNNATCVDGINGYTCRCLSGYNGAHCQIGTMISSSFPTTLLVATTLLFRQVTIETLQLCVVHNGRCIDASPFVGNRGSRGRCQSRGDFGSYRCGFVGSICRCFNPFSLGVLDVLT